jgi:type VI protein secretion system component VasK
MSDISFPGLGAFIIFLLLLAFIGVVLLISLFKLIRSKKRWPCHQFFGFFMGSTVAVIITLFLLYLAETGSIILMETLDNWAIAIATLILVNTIFVGWWYWRKNTKRC